MAQEWRKEFFYSILTPEQRRRFSDVNWLEFPYKIIECSGRSRDGPWICSGLTGFRSPREALEDVVRRCHQDFHEFCVEYLNNAWALVCYRQLIIDKNKVFWDRYILGPYNEFKEILRLYNITPKFLEPEPKTAEDKLRKYAQLGYEFQVLKRWNKHYLYARKWMPEEKKRRSKYIGPWTENLKKLAEEIGIKPTYYA